MRAPRLFIPVGIPGCGKSTWAEQVMPIRFIVSTDTIRELFVIEGRLESVNDMSGNDEVFERYHNDIAFRVHQGDDVYADATNLRDYAREKLRNVAKEFDAETHVIVFNNLHEAITRNYNRERTVRVEVMIRMLEQFEKALRDIANEEYTSVTFIESMT